MRALWETHDLPVQQIDEAIFCLDTIGRYSQLGGMQHIVSPELLNPYYQTRNRIESQKRSSIAGDPNNGSVPLRLGPFTRHFLKKALTYVLDSPQEIIGDIGYVLGQEAENETYTRARSAVINHRAIQRNAKEEYVAKALLIAGLHRQIWGEAPALPKEVHDTIQATPGYNTTPPPTTESPS
jgi:hypothetical protein